ncbi:hypothetical protein PHYBLDRAFT_76316 [Phycomyces blakesleeanus NRRL 1555(-)]|uniref:3'-5' exonuclease domain-containing protein n=2 Tax=Phycomyces blakesleeanus TaxID=4837 RepID=A0A163B3Q7_PHYB8|nr:hypothetical protein PHYBLDRAFT_76316 [Phycomyces blakesleeanus NRRL 1555(-)]OAD78151.1 hypothetical protein PHYBLDRAFT_76316 [Phycomyces blakesleeanus NRRL 1555(-)]|eukprot:XP_018296191.1 hypothetical protein PHYBLDRAFT_76316 [Phycomyces blakesleeanus NRRL 1555(-)]
MDSEASPTNTEETVLSVHTYWKNTINVCEAALSMLSVYENKDHALVDATTEPLRQLIRHGRDIKAMMEYKPTPRDVNTSPKKQRKPVQINSDYDSNWEIVDSSTVNVTLSDNSVVVCKAISTRKELEEIIPEIRQSRCVALDCEFLGIKNSSPELKLLQIAVSRTRGYAVMINTIGNRVAMELLGPILTDNSINLVGWAFNADGRAIENAFKGLLVTSVLDLQAKLRSIVVENLSLANGVTRFAKDWEGYEEFQKAKQLGEMFHFTGENCVWMQDPLPPSALVYAVFDVVSLVALFEITEHEETNEKHFWPFSITLEYNRKALDKWHRERASNFAEGNNNVYIRNTPKPSLPQPAQRTSENSTSVVPSNGETQSNENAQNKSEKTVEQPTKKSFETDHVAPAEISPQQPTSNGSDNILSHTKSDRRIVSDEQTNYHELEASHSEDSYEYQFAPDVYEESRKNTKAPVIKPGGWSDFTRNLPANKQNTNSNGNVSGSISGSVSGNVGGNTGGWGPLTNNSAVSNPSGWAALANNSSNRRSENSGLGLSSLPTTNQSYPSRQPQSPQLRQPQSPQSAQSPQQRPIQAQKGPASLQLQTNPLPVKQRVPLAEHYSEKPDPQRPPQSINKPAALLVSSTPSVSDSMFAPVSPSTSASLTATNPTQSNLRPYSAPPQTIQPSNFSQNNIKSNSSNDSGVGKASSQDAEPAWVKVKRGLDNSAVNAQSAAFQYGGQGSFEWQEPVEGEIDDEKWKELMDNSITHWRQGKDMGLDMSNYERKKAEAAKNINRPTGSTKFNTVIGTSGDQRRGEKDSWDDVTVRPNTMQMALKGGPKIKYKPKGPRFYNAFDDADSDSDTDNDGLSSDSDGGGLDRNMAVGAKANRMGTTATSSSSAKAGTTEITGAAGSIGASGASGAGANAGASDDEIFVEDFYLVDGTYLHLYKINEVKHLAHIPKSLPDPSSPLTIAFTYYAYVPRNRRMDAGMILKALQIHFPTGNTYTILVEHIYNALHTKKNNELAYLLTHPRVNRVTWAIGFMAKTIEETLGIKLGSALDMSLKLGGTDGHQPNFLQCAEKYIKDWPNLGILKAAKDDFESASNRNFSNSIWDRENVPIMALQYSSLQCAALYTLYTSTEKTIPDTRAFMYPDYQVAQNH